MFKTIKKISFLLFVVVFFVVIKSNSYAKNVNSFNYITDRIGNEITVLNNDLKKVMTYDISKSEKFYEVKEPDNSDVVALCKSTRIEDKNNYNYKLYDLDGKYKQIDFETHYAYEIYFDSKNYIFNLGNSFVIFNIIDNTKKVIENVTAFRFFYEHYIFSSYNDKGLFPGLLIYDSNFDFLKKIDNYQDNKIIENNEKYENWLVSIEGVDYYRINYSSSDGINLINKNMEVVFPEAFYEVKDEYKNHIIEAIYRGHKIIFDCLNKTVLNILVDENYTIIKEIRDKFVDMYGDEIENIEYAGEIEDRYIVIKKKDKSKDIYTKDLKPISKNVGLIEYKKINDYIFTSDFRVTNVLDRDLNNLKSLLLDYSDVKSYSFNNQNIYVFYNENNDFVDIYNDDLSKNINGVKIFNADILKDGVLVLSRDMDINKNYTLEVYNFSLENLYDTSGEKKIIRKARELVKINRYGLNFYYKKAITTSNDSELFDSRLNKIFDGFSTADFDSFNDKIIIYFYKTNLISVVYDNFSLFKQYENATLLEKIKIDVLSRQHFVIGTEYIDFSILCSNDRYSILDENLNVIVSDLIDANDFKEKYFKFRKNDMVGFMDYSGNVLFEMKY